MPAGVIPYAGSPMHTQWPNAGERFYPKINRFPYPWNERLPVTYFPPLAESARVIADIEMAIPTAQ